MEGLEAEHWPRNLLDEPMIPLNYIVQIIGLDDVDKPPDVRELKDNIETLKTGQVGAVFVDDNPVWPTVTSSRFGKEGGRSCHITSLRQHEIKSLTLLVYRTLEIKTQIAKAARRVGTGSVSYDFNNSYQMEGVVFSIGNTTIGVTFSGQSKEQNGILSIKGRLEIYLDDEFSDPLDIGEFHRDLGNEDAENVEVDDYRPGSILYDNIHKPLDDYLRGRGRLPSNGRLRLGVREGVPYSITGQWSGRLEERIYANASRSRYT